MDKDHDYFVDDWNKNSDTDNFQDATFELEDNWNWFNSKEKDISNKWWNNWLTDDFKKQFNLRRQEFWDAQIAEAYKVHGALLATCWAGIECQNQVKADFIKELRTEWHTTLQKFHDIVEL